MSPVGRCPAQEDTVLWHMNLAGYGNSLRYQGWIQKASKRAQQGKALPTKPNDLSSFPEIHMVEGES